MVLYMDDSYNLDGGVLLVDSISKSMYKAMTWRIIAFVISVIVVFFFTGSLEVSFVCMVVVHTIKTVVYYFHERVWCRWMK